MKIGVLGAGVVGLSSAWWLAEAGHRVVLIDRHIAPGAEASAANGAQLSYAFVAPMASPAMLRKLPFMLFGGEDAIRISPDLELIRWGIRFLRACTENEVARTMAAQLALAALSRLELAQLMQSHSFDFGLRTAGKLVLYRHTNDFAAARRDAGAAIEQQALTPAECLAVEPALRLAASALSGGIYTPSEQVGDCGVFCAQLYARLRQHSNVEVCLGASIGRPRIARGALTGIETSGGVIEAEYLISRNLGIKMRYVNEKYEGKEVVGKIDGQHVGVFASIYF